MPIAVTGFSSETARNSDAPLFGGCSEGNPAEPIGNRKRKPPVPLSPVPSILARPNIGTRLHSGSGSDISYGFELTHNGDERLLQGLARAEGIYQRSIHYNCA